MPSPLTHLLVGRSALGVLRPAESPQYYLGCVLPDAPNLDGFAPKEVRWAAHLRDADPDRWVANAVGFAASRAPAQRSLALGYAVHTAADAVWDDCFEAGLRKALDGKRLSREELFERRWNEHRRFEREQLEADWWLLETRPLLAQARPEGINGLPEELARRYLRYLLEDYSPAVTGKAVGYVTEELVEEFGAHVSKRLAEAGLGG